MLFAAYRADQYADPEGFMASLGMVLETYPDDVIAFVTSPLTGVQRTHTWPPALAEVIAACNNRVGDLLRKKQYENWGKTNSNELDGPRDSRPTLAELKAKYGETFGIVAEPFHVPRLDTHKIPTAADIIAHYGIRASGKADA